MYILNDLIKLLLSIGFIREDDIHSYTLEIDDIDYKICIYTTYLISFESTNSDNLNFNNPADFKKFIMRKFPNCIRKLKISNLLNKQ